MLEAAKRISCAAIVEMEPALPAHRRLADSSEISLVDQGGRMQGVPRPFPEEVSASFG
jgi:hypothetical protein